jgi:ubiquinone/menaquinone biosynthesis C-methylase UbiE
MQFKIGEEANQVWIKFLENKNNLGHNGRENVKSDISEYVQKCWESSLSTAINIKKELPYLSPDIILEVGCSAGLNCYALKNIFPAAKVIGLEPEVEAINVANSMSGNIRLDKNPEFKLGVGEEIPLQSNSVDLIVCHTVIEHVKDVERVIFEMARVLKPGGYLHIEAPNYVWPHEPHLDIWCIPLLGKPFVRFFGLLQRKNKNIGFLDHLKFVTPFRLERCFKVNKLDWDNRVQQKIFNALQGDQSQVKAYRRSAAALQMINRLGLGRLLGTIILRTGFYPSVLYTVRKPCDA